MVPEVQEFADRLDEIRRQAREAIQGLDGRGLNAAPLDEDTSSPAVLVHHMAGVERFWLRQIIGGVDIGRSRPDEFVAKAATVADLEGLLEEAGRTTREVLSELVAEQLHETRDARGEQRSIQWCLLGMMDHLSGHVGHLQLTRQMYDKVVTGPQPERRRAQ
jgi:uncharacterized damage-inducible protein DinB